MSDRMAEARRLLQHHFGYSDFRPAQIPVISSVFEGRDTLAVLPTGGGKSICFQIPALVLPGLTVVVSPLISLMQDQVEAARARGVSAACLNSSLGTAEQQAVRQAMADGSLRLLYVSPERLERLSQEFGRRGIRPTLLVIDEAHCIAEWGHDFRPSYRKLSRARYRLGQPQAVALTGSATAAVREDIARALRFRPGFAFHLGSFDRPNLWFGAVQVGSERQRLQALLALLRGDDAMAIVYTPTRGSTEAVARALCEAGHRAAPYHAGLTKATRAGTLEDFLRDRVDIIVATCAFGMGIDKPSVRLVVHWTPPPTPEAYYQEAGRAGRDGEFARCVLLWRAADADLHRRQLDVTFPSRRLLERIWHERDGRVGVPRNVLESAERLRRELHPERGPVDWRPIRERRKQAEARIQAVEDYARESRCRRSRLVGYFGEALGRCAGCDRCGARPAPSPADPRVSARLARLRQALSDRRTVWGGCPLEPDVLLRLARRPPANAAALADVPGVGAALAERLGGTILHALSPGSTVILPRDNTLLPGLEEWRAGVAREMGVPPYTVVTDAVLRAMSHARPQTLIDLARIRGVGPRLLAKFADDLLRFFRSDDSATPPLDHWVPN
ncbi:MAG TPA: RecQ family ATP-dependent DNA helicase, partial [Gemmatimonadales bacterium]|nr:RecQ family ATP-dependent DNA helicase [Gemmatimonadales bacterium]